MEEDFAKLRINFENNGNKFDFLLSNDFFVRF